MHNNIFVMYITVKLIPWNRSYESLDTGIFQLPVINRVPFYNVFYLSLLLLANHACSIVSKNESMYTFLYYDHSYIYRYMHSL